MAKEAANNLVETSDYIGHHLVNLTFGWCEKTSSWGFAHHQQDLSKSLDSACDVSEMGFWAFIQIGNASITGVPGELYPEIAVGGIENPVGADYDIAPQEVPHLRSQFPDKLNLMVNLANDAIGYIIPKSEWDEDAPWIYGENEETYGEVVSLGPNTAVIIHENLVKLIEESKIIKE